MGPKKEARKIVNQQNSIDKTVIQNNYTSATFEDAALLLHIKNYFSNFILEAEAMEEKLKNDFPEVNQEEFKTKYLEFLKFNIRKFEKSLFPYLHDTIELKNQAAVKTIQILQLNPPPLPVPRPHRHKRILLFKLFQVLFPYKFKTREH